MIALNYNATIKENFDEMYVAPSPLQYVRRMEEVGYQIPHHAQPLHQAFIVAVADVLGAGPRSVGVTDVGCSYGINAALLNDAAGLRNLYAHYRDLAASTADDLCALAERDRRHWRADAATRLGHVHGVDSSHAAIKYARGVGLLEAGVATDLEGDAADPASVLARYPRDHALISTGAVGYVTARTLGALVEHMARPRMLLVFVLRSVDYSDCIAAYAAQGMNTIKLPGLYPQRQFASAEEHDQTVGFLAERGVDTRDAEQRGYQFAECYLTTETPVLTQQLREQLEPLTGVKEPI